MKSFHFYDEASGILSPNSVSIHAPDAENIAQLNCPPGHKPIEGVSDPLAQRVDVATGEVIDYQPQQPSPDHDWNAETKRWGLTAEAQAKEQGRQAARVRIAALEASSVAVMREMLLDNLAARPRLQAIADEIAALEQIARL